MLIVQARCVAHQTADGSSPTQPGRLTLIALDEGEKGEVTGPVTLPVSVSSQSMKEGNGARTMHTLFNKRLRIVTGLTEDGLAIHGERTVDKLLEVLSRRADRLVDDRDTRERLRPALRAFVYNVVEYFAECGELDEYVMTNIMTALATSDSHGPSAQGVEDYSTFIRRPNPIDPDTFKHFVVGRDGRIDDPGCPLNHVGRRSGALANIPAAQLLVFRAFHFARSKDATRGAPRIPVEVLRDLVPVAVRSSPVLEDALLDVCFSDGAWELYQLRLAA